MSDTFLKMTSDISSPQHLFPTLSEVDIKRRSEAERRLPTWLSQPTQFQASNLENEAQEIEDFADHIDQELINHIKVNLNFHKLFPVQRCLVPVLSRQFKCRAFRRPNDICVSSPTGSGKTLAYVIPIVNKLKRSLARELRAIVALPTRDLATQVYKTFNQVAQHTHLRCALATDEDQSFYRKVSRGTGDIREAHTQTKPQHASSALIVQNSYDDVIVTEDEFVSTIDILISTPGTLVDLIQNSPEFFLKDLEILVIDEADRLMVNHKHDWLNAIERAVAPKTYECPCMDPDSLNYESQGSEGKPSSNYYTACGCTMRHSHQSRFIHKLLFSATLSSDPQILMHMNLFQPRLFLATKPSLASTKIRNSLGTPMSTPVGSPVPRFAANAPVNSAVTGKTELLTTMAIPEQLEEKMFITETKDKLYVMWYILSELKYKKVLCFTNDKRKCWELFVFLNEIVDVRAVNFSSEVKPEVRQKYLNEFKNEKLDVIVATDLVGRGMDIDGIEYVISYDMPMSGTWYAHRVGRTARAGKKGTAITLVDSKQLVQFKKIVQQAHKMPNSMRLSDVVEEMKVPHFSQKDDKRESYIKTYENYKDKINAIRMRQARFKTRH